MDKVKVALLGTGKVMTHHARRMRANPDAQIVALCDTNEAAVQAFVEKNLGDRPRPALFTDAAAMYARAQPDAVVIATPHTLHYQHAVQALDAGCHIYMEKPMVTSLDHAYALRDKAKQAGKIVVIGYNGSCSPELNYLRDQVRNQSLGKLEMVHGYISQPWLQATGGTWRQDPALSGGGQAYDSGAHLLNTLCWSVESEVDQVFAFVDHHGTRVDINSSIAIRFVNGVTACLTISGNCPSSAEHIVFIFENGRVETDGKRCDWINLWQRDPKEPLSDRKIKYPPITGKEQFPDDNFIDAILGRDQPRTSPQNGVIQSQLMDAIYESARTGQPASPRRG